jgi:hypothetical protein
MENGEWGMKIVEILTSPGGSGSNQTPSEKASAAHSKEHLINTW